MRAFAGSGKIRPKTLMFSTNSATGVRALLKMASAFSAAPKARSWLEPTRRADGGSSAGGWPSARHPDGGLIST
jgi:hypothetical protein